MCVCVRSVLVHVKLRYCYKVADASGSGDGVQRTTAAGWRKHSGLSAPSLQSPVLKICGCLVGSHGNASLPLLVSSGSCCAYESNTLRLLPSSIRNSRRGSTYRQPAHDWHTAHFAPENMLLLDDWLRACLFESRQTLRLYENHSPY